MRPRSEVWIYAAVAVLMVAGAREALALDAGTFTNPIIANGQDPWVTQYNGNYYYVWSQNNSIFVSESSRLEEIGYGAPKAVFQPPPGTAYSQELWAPELHRLDDKWYIYLAADDGDNANHRMYVLEGNSSDPLGSFTFKGQIGDATDKWAIDGTVWDRAPGERYFIWSGWEGDVNVRQKLYIAPMSDPWTISGPRVEISTPQFNWERIGDPDVNEGPQVLTRDGVTHVIFSASGAWTDDYTLGRLTFTGSDPLNPVAWTKHNQPVFSRTADVFGPGHASFVKSPDGAEDWIVYHAAKQQGSGFDRNVLIQPFTFEPDGVTPNFGTPVSPSAPIAVPSGFFDNPVIRNGSFERDHVVDPGQPGFSLQAEGYEKSGSVTVLANDGRFFAPIHGGEGVQVAAIRAGEEQAHGIAQVIEPIRPGTYQVAAALALSDDQLADALAWPGQFVLRLSAVPRSGSQQEVVLDEVTIGSAQLLASAFSTFQARAVIDPTSNLLGRDLRLSLHSAGVAAGSPFWQVKVDSLSLQAELTEPARPRVDLNFSGQGSHLGATGFQAMYGVERADFTVANGKLAVRTVPGDTFGQYEADPDNATNLFFSTIDPLDRTVVEASLQIDGLSENFQGGGIWLGTDQDHYIRLGVIHNSQHPQGPLVLEVLRENEELWTGAGGPGNDIAIEQLALTGGQPLSILLRLVREGSTARAYFSVDDGVSFSPIGGVFDAIATSPADGPSVEGGFKVGLYAFGGQTVGGASFAFDWFSAVSSIAGDLDGDGFVGIGDLNIVLGNWNQSVPAGDTAVGDLSGDGFVGIEDLNVVLGNWNAGTPPGAPPAAAVPEPTGVLGWAWLMALMRRRVRGE